jgi:hypothetical protein
VVVQNLVFRLAGHDFLPQFPSISLSGLTFAKCRSGAS